MKKQILELGDIPSRSKSVVKEVKQNKPVKNVPKEIKPTKKIVGKAKTPTTKKIVGKAKAPTAKPAVKTKTIDKSTRKDPALIELQKNKQALIDEGNALLEQIGENVFDDNRRYVAQYESMFKQLIVISGIAETKYLESKQGKDIYALMKVYDQMRECIADMKSLQSVGHYIDALVQDVLNPLGTSFSQTMLEFVNNVNSYVKNHRNIDPAVQAEMVAYVGTQSRTVAIGINEAYHASLENTSKILAG